MASEHDANTFIAYLIHRCLQDTAGLAIVMVLIFVVDEVQKLLYSPATVLPPDRPAGDVAYNKVNGRSLATKCAS